MMPKTAPIGPGEILAEEFLKPLKMTQDDLAQKLGLSLNTVNMLINGRRSVTADTAIRLGKTFKTSPEFWLNLQNAVDLWQAQQRQEAAHG
jgi:addiction module HigA family antidote